MFTRSWFHRASVTVAALALMSGAWGEPQDQWVALPNGTWEVQAGSALDLSALPLPRFGDASTAVQVRGGQFTRSGAGAEGLRFFCATLSVSPNTGGFPDHGNADRVARNLRRSGYNAVRVHMVEAQLMSGRSGDFNFDPEQLDRLHYLLAALRKEGMYLFVDMVASWNGAYGDVRSHRWSRGQHDVVLGSLLPGAERAHWLELVKRLWGSKNKYTGLALLKDPAVAGVILVNEGEPDYLLRAGQSAVLAPAFQDWVLKTEGAARKAALPAVLPSVSGRGEETSAFQRFSLTLQEDQAQWMRAQLRALGYAGPITAFNTSPSYHTAVSRRSLDFVDMHQYADLPNGMVDAGASVRGQRLLDGKNRYMDRLAWTRLWGQPYTVSEYGQPFWNRWRWEVAPLTAAYARLQGWDMITHFGDNLNLQRPGSGRWRQMLVPFDVSTDPTLRAGETIAAFLFGRGDVAPSAVGVHLALDPEEAAGLPADAFVGWSTAQIQYVAKVGLNWTSSNGAEVAGRMRISRQDEDIKTEALLQRMKDRGLLAKDHPVGGGLGPFLSSTRQLWLDPRQQRMTVATPATVGLLGSAGSAVGRGGVRLELLQGEGALFVSALDKPDLAQSERALMVLATEARNSGMRFRDAAETVIEHIGSFPALLRSATVRVSMPAPSGGRSWRLFVLDESGRRQMTLPLERDPQGGVSALIRLAALGDRASPYFEWIQQ